jgi:DNA primase
LENNLLVNNLKEVILQLEPYLVPYLEEHGYSTSSNFQCINPEHEDNKPSCGVFNEGKTFHCFSCQCSGNVLHAANFIEKKPLSGPGFITDNVLYLADKFGIEVERREPTEAEIYEINTYQAYRIASEYITNCSKSAKVLKEIENRQWDEQICKDMSIGSVPSFKEFRDYMKHQGFAATFLDEIDLGRRKRGTQLFSENNLIYTIKDHHGRPVGFASKNLDFNNQEGESKFVNQATTGLKCNIYQKGTRLFNLNHVYSKYKNKKKPVWIFEGYSDVVSARKNGIDNCVAIGSASFTIDQLYLLKECGFYNLIIALDSDNTGRTKTAKLVDDIFAGHKDVNIKIVVIPEEKDPDEFIRDSGIDSFLSLERWDAFEWRLNQFSDETDEIICAAMVPLIVNEPNFIKQEKMVKTLAEATGISAGTINAEVGRLQNERENKKSHERKDVIDKMFMKLARNPENAEIILSEAQTGLYDLMRKYNEDNLSNEKFLARLVERKTYEENKSDKFSGFVLGPDLEVLQNILNGEWREDVFVSLGARANSGKTSMLVKLAMAIAENYEENNAIVIYHSIDDTFEQLLPKFVAVAEGGKDITLNEIANPNYHSKLDENILKKRDKGYKRLEELGKEGKLIIKDANDGNSLAFSESILKYYRTKYPDKKIVYILDNLHKLSDLARSGADAQAYKSISHKVKELVGKYHVCGIFTIEYTKLEPGTKPTNHNISGSAQFDYDANLSLHLYNDLNEKRDRAEQFHTTVVDGKLLKLPRIEVIVAKNKITDFKGSIYANFYPAHSEFVFIDTRLVLAEMEENKNNKEPQYPKIY